MLIEMGNQYHWKCRMNSWGIFNLNLESWILNLNLDEDGFYATNALQRMKTEIGNCTNTLDRAIWFLPFFSVLKYIIALYTAERVSSPSDSQRTTEAKPNTKVMASSRNSVRSKHCIMQRGTFHTTWPSTVRGWHFSASYPSIVTKSHCGHLHFIQTHKMLFLKFCGIINFLQPIKTCNQLFLLRVSSL